MAPDHHRTSAALRCAVLALLPAVAGCAWFRPAPPPPLPAGQVAAAVRRNAARFRTVTDRKAKLLIAGDADGDTQKAPSLGANFGFDRSRPALYLPFQLHREGEVDERFDGIVYAVALVGGATCVIHLNNLPRVIAASPYRDALAPGAAPDLRDLLILATSPGFAAELGQGLVVILVAVLVGAVLGTLQLRGWSPSQTAFVCVVVALATTGLDLLTGGAWPVRGALAVTAVAVAAAIKRRSVFKARPELPERDVLIMGLKTVLMVFGAALLATVLLQAVVEQPVTGSHPSQAVRLGQGS